MPTKCHKDTPSNIWLFRYSSTDQLAMNGVTVGGTKYMFLSANDRVVRARKGQSGVHCIKTVQGTKNFFKSMITTPKTWVEYKEADRMRLCPFAQFIPSPSDLLHIALHGHTPTLFST